jgi:HAE1 family hydrophobic/amphiphilic exporter-1
MALTLCVGFAVDDAIAMLENITRHMEMGNRGCSDADGSKEIGFTIVSMTISLVACSSCCSWAAFSGGAARFAVTIIVAVSIGPVSLSSR